MELTQAVVVVNFNALDKEKATLFSIPDFYEKEIHKAPYLPNF